MNAEELKTALAADGWRFSEDHLNMSRDPRWYAWKPAKTKVHCECNEKPPQITIWPWDYQPPQGERVRSMEMELCGERKGQWYKLSAYSMKIGVDDIEAVSRSLVSAWEAI